jgi:hypothetical protein
MVIYMTKLRKREKEMVYIRIKIEKNRIRE